MKGKKVSWQKVGIRCRNKVYEIELSKCVHLSVGHFLSYGTFFLSGSSLQAFLSSETPMTSMHPAILAELSMAMLVIHHNTFFNLSDHQTPYINNEFKSWCAAENFLSERTYLCHQNS